MTTRTKWLILLGILAACGWFAFLAVYQVDDAYIVYRYARNLARGEGFVFNPGERVEGVTCFLWTLLLAPFGALGLPLPRVGPILTALAGLGALLMLPRLSARLGGRDRPDRGDAGAAVLLAAHPAFAYWCVGGLETLPYTLLVMLALHDQLSEQARGGGRRSAVWLGLAALMRPEAPLLAAGLAAGRACDGPGRSPRERLRDQALWWGVLASFLAPFLVFRRLYFGDWLPNTYYAKTGFGLMQNLHDGRVYTLAFLSSLAPGFGREGLATICVGVGLLLALLAFALPLQRARSAALVVGALALAVLLEGGDWMVLHRFWVPALPAIVALLVEAGRAASKALPGSRRALVLGGVILGASFLTSGVIQRNGANGLVVNGAGYRYAHGQVASFLKARARPGDTVALMDIGIIGYETDLRIIDISGLTEPAIARAPGGFLHKEYPAGALVDAAPRFFVLVNDFPIDDAITARADFKARYRLVLERNHRFNWEPPQSYTLHVYERRDDARPPPA